MGPYQIPQGTSKNNTTVVLYCVTMIDPATGWFEIKKTKTRSFDVVVNIVEQTWFTRMSMGSNVNPLLPEIPKQTPLWKELTKPLVIFYVPLSQDLLNWIQKTHGVEY
eukprot:6447277-Ditylum_brightwellii.AAC.1